MKRSAVRPSPLFLGLLAAVVAGAALTLVESDVAIKSGTILFVLAGWAVTLCLHEFGHAAVAYKGGDFSVRDKGYLTLDIRRYTDPVLSIVLPLVLLVMGGIPLPGGAVWINHHALRNKRIESLVSLAGPISNLVIGVLLAFVVAFTSPPAALANAISYLALLQVFAFLLNILPVPGLDGWGAIEPFLPYEAQRFGAKVRPWAPLVLFALLIAFSEVSGTFFRLSLDLFRLIGGDPYSAFVGSETFMFWRSI
ncbi:site-2 protease family protein [Lentzea sp. NBRC 102530]|uniref:site-2 protease family protein n=1 Tax=Lentzea sp. NBRC 102530 TaxID=3032201 RepID=UPI0024A41EDB|nr:site-2 protease family protein [Lentzea sp. NBRC 102530]GLY52851.1 peptidase M50 [Lentzea sp. NBRC 102530]